MKALQAGGALPGDAFFRHALASHLWFKVSGCPTLYRVVFWKPLHSFSCFGLQDATVRAPRCCAPTPPCCAPPSPQRPAVPPPSPRHARYRPAKPAIAPAPCRAPAKPAIAPPNPPSPPRPAVPPPCPPSPHAPAACTGAALRRPYPALRRPHTALLRPYAAPAPPPLPRRAAAPPRCPAVPLRRPRRPRTALLRPHEALRRPFTQHSSPPHTIQMKQRSNYLLHRFAGHLTCRTEGIEGVSSGSKVRRHTINTSPIVVERNVTHG